MSHKTKRLPIIVFPGCDTHIVQTSIKDKLPVCWMSDYVFTGMHLYILQHLSLPIHLHLSLRSSIHPTVSICLSLFDSSLILSVCSLSPSLSFHPSLLLSFSLSPFLFLSSSLSLRYQSYFSLVGQGHDWVERGGN